MPTNHLRIGIFRHHVMHRQAHSAGSSPYMAGNTTCWYTFTTWMPHSAKPRTASISTIRCFLGAGADCVVAMASPAGEGAGGMSSR